MNTEQSLSNAVSEEAKKQHVAETNEYVHGTPTVVDQNVSCEIGHFGGVEHNLKRENEPKE